MGAGGGPAEPSANRYAPFLMTGVLGGFTTFSAFSLDAVTLYGRGQGALAAPMSWPRSCCRWPRCVAGLTLARSLGMSGVQTVTVAGRGRSAAGPLAEAAFPQLAQGRIEKLCRKGELRVDGGRAKASTRLAAGQQVRIPPLPEPGQVDSAPKPQVTDQDAGMIRDCVIYRDDHMIAINKPAGPGPCRAAASRPAMSTAWPRRCASGSPKSRVWCTGWTRIPRRVLLMARTARWPPRR